MKLIVHLIPRQPGAEAVIAASVAGCTRHASGGFAMEIDHPALRAAIASGERLGGLGISAEWRLTEAELASLSHFSVVCRLTVPESDAAYKRNYDMCQASPQIASGAGASIRLARGFCLSKASLKPNSVAGIGEWTGAYLAGEDVLEAFRQAGLTGLASEPVLQTSSRAPFPNVRQLVTEAILPAAVPGALPDFPPGYCGLLCYEPRQLIDQPDFSHTAEPWASQRYGWPLWVVSARTRNLFLLQGMSGWAFRPVLVTDSALYERYLALSQELCALLRDAPQSKLEDREW